MSSPSARAEARRKAILGRGGDRLAKLTTSARGEDAPAYRQDDAPMRGAAAGLSAFVGEETDMPPPPPPPKEAPRASPPPYAFASASQPDPSAWSQEQQMQFMQALMGGALNPPAFPQSQPQLSAPPTVGSRAGSLPPDDPFASMMAQLQQMDPSRGGAAGKAPAAPAAPKPATRFQKLMPLIHVVCMWCLLAFFVLWKEPQIFVEKTAGAVEVVFWKRWPKLALQGTDEGGWGVQVVPFFWAFMTLQVMLHSMRIFSGRDEVRPPALLAFALPHLPSPFPSLITNGLRYFRMGGVFLDDLAAIVFGLGIVIAIASCLAG
ncbi:hypothetical protein HYDPIDRAFT_32194 [Hydnomerulius pinastri MD-312]|uniref:Golgi to ER traffic protein 2 n=1 Tax=Hydnomerulius pinastri MD-312 TaxID=994086 RepID=A0A0C9VZ63_9AGAM|nr:hypothetical protein HYDPIDRAFT_33876 [Hydnomerulius pinastri MD-312]KIJ60565.1 hypothetical protein HYDPIDRAFT_32194 [Hydnomerulius pinastri MD-312]